MVSDVGQNSHSEFDQKWDPIWARICIPSLINNGMREWHVMGVWHVMSERHVISG